MASAQPAAEHKKPAGGTGNKQETPAQGRNKGAAKRAAAPGLDQDQARDPAKRTGASPPGTTPAGQENKASSDRFDRMAVRAKLAVSEPGDAVEREADAVADKVMRTTETPDATGKQTEKNTSAKPAGDSIARAAAPAENTGKKADAGNIGKAQAPAAGKNTAPAAEKPTRSESASQNKIKREAAAPEEIRGTAPQTGKTGTVADKKTGSAENGVQRKENPASANSSTDKPGTHSELTSRLGSGQPVDAATRAFFEPRLGRDLSDVRIHTDGAAAQSSRQIAARAFTFGNHIAFAQGEYQPDSEPGKRLLAHELAHVMQNDDQTTVHAVQRKIDPKFDKPDDLTDAATDPVKKKAALPALQTLKLPAIKARHAEAYKKKASAKTLKRPKGYDRETPAFSTEQEKKWKDGITLTAHYNTIGYKEGEGNQTLTFYGAPPRPLTGTATELLDKLKVPKWSPDGSWFETGMQIDHIIEAQVNGEDAFSNYELLSGPHNNSSGAKLSQAIRANLRTYLQAIDKNPSKNNVDLYLQQNDIDFTKVEGGGESKTNSEKGAQFWSSTQINAGTHLSWLKPDAKAEKDDGTKKDRFALYSFTGQGFIEAFSLHGTTVGVSSSGRLHGIKLASIQLNPGFEKAGPGTSIGTLTGTWELPKGVAGPEEQLVVTLNAIDKKPYAGAMASLPPPTLQIQGASPVTFTQIDFLRGEVTANGTLTTTHEMFPGVEIPVRWRGGEFAFEHTFSTDNLKLSLPGVTVDEAGLTLSFGSQGLGAEGMVGFTVAGFGNGMIIVGMKTGGETPILTAKGTLTADRKLFDQAAISIAYSSNEGFSGKGTLAITNPEKIKGIKSAKLTASYAKSVFTATGDVNPDIPGLKSTSLGVTYDKSLLITGKLTIDEKVPGVESAEITVSVKEEGDKWKVAASGFVNPKLPGLKGAQLKFDYNDGFVLLEGKFRIKTGPLDGEFIAGVTNASVNEKGERGNTGSGNTFTAYGSALISAEFIKDKLTGKLKLRLLPDGTTRVGGGLAVNDFEVFKKIPENDQLFRNEINSPKIPIPGLGFSVGSVSVGVTFWGSGFIRAFASVGPGKLTGISVDVEEFNPDTVTFADLVIKGKGSFEVPANAGLEIGAAAHIGLSAAIVEADASIGITGKVEIPEDKQPVLKAKSSFKYNQNTGLDIMNDIQLNIQPALEFALKGKVAVNLNLLVDTITLWSKDWTLGKASFDLPIGISAKGSLGYNSQKNSLTTSAENLLTVENPDFDNPENMRKILDGSGPDPVITNTDAAGNEVPDRELMSLPPDPALQVCSMDEPDQSVMPGESVLPKREDGTSPDNGSAPPSSLRGGQSGAPRQQGLNETDIQALGAGAEMNLAIRGFFEQRMGRNLSMVRIFVGSRANELAQRISARAFTVGNRIIFAHGEYRPEDENGKELLAHELAHVGQQQDGAARMLMRFPNPPSTGSSASTPPSTPTPAPGATSTPAPATTPAAAGAPPATTAGSASPSPVTTATASAGDFTVSTPLEIPPIKSRHAPAYQLMAGQNLLRRRAGYNSATRGSAQVPGWLSGVTADLNRVPVAQRPTTATGVTLALNIAGGASTKTIAEPDIAAMNRRLKIPNWDAAGGDIEYQVDHMVEFQLGGADDIQNFELLNQAHNGSVGSSFNYEIRRALRTEIQNNPTSPQLNGYSGARDSSNRPTVEGVMQWKDIVFTRTTVRTRESRRREGGSSYWSKQQIDNMDHVLPMLGGNGPLQGTTTSFALLSPTGNMLISQFPHGASELNINVGRRAPGNRGGIAGLTIDRIRLNQGYNAAAGDTVIGDLVGNIDFGPNITIPPDTVTLPITQAQAPGQFSGRIGAPVGGGPASAEFTPMSQLDFSSLTFGQGVFGQAVLHPGHPALAGLNIPATIQNGRVGLFYSVDATTLAERLRIPGLSINSASITFGYDGQAFSVSGGTEFSIRNFGEGHLEAMVDSDGKFQLEGGFRADTRLFDRADMNLWYRSATGFGGNGTLAITNPGKIRGVRAASVTATYDNGVFSASGTVEPDIPGVQSAGLSVRYGPDETGADSLLIAGDLTLASGVPGIQGGQVHVELAQHNEQWSVAGTGDIRPDLPGVDSDIHLEYREGVFTGELSVDYAQSIFSGNVTVGLTNRPVTPEGEAQTSGEPENTLKLYGSGTLNARLTEQLQGSVGLRVRPGGDIRISGSIGIADAVTLFDQYPPPERARRELFRMPTVSIPLVGIAVGGNTVGLALTINGRIEGHAFVGPGQLTQAEIRVEDFNPAQPESLHISGDARFSVPAEAGVDASLDAGVSLGAAVIRATAGISVSAGVTARAEVAPAAHIDWRPDTGLHLHADLNATLTPSLRFGVNGYAEVVADAFVTSFSLWRKDWNLAQREIGSSLSLGVHVPVDYYSDGRGVQFDPDAVTFQVPELSADLLGQLMNDNGTENVEGRRTET